MNELALYQVHIPELEQDGEKLVLACCVEVKPQGIGFHDTNRGHFLGGRLEKETLQGFLWRRTESGKDRDVVKFDLVDLATFEKEIRPQIKGWLPDKFASTAELWEFYRRAYGKAGYHGGSGI